MKRALIFGVGGQDGSYLAELLLGHDYEVHGVIRRSSDDNTRRIKHLLDQEAIFNRRFFLHYADLQDSGSIAEVIKNVHPDEIYNLAAMSQVRISYDMPELTMDVTGLGAMRIMEAVRHFDKNIKIYQASSSEMFGEVLETPQDEETPLNPLSPYGEAKELAHRYARTCRNAYGMWVSCGIFFNHESPRRGDNFVSKKIVKAAVRIARGEQDKLYLGNLESKRDWGYAKEYVEWVWKIMQFERPEVFVIATGENHTVKEFVEETFKNLNLDWKKYVIIDESFMSPYEVDTLQGCYGKAKNLLGFSPKVKFKELVELMVRYELGTIQT